MNYYKPLYSGLYVKIASSTLFACTNNISTLFKEDIEPLVRVSFIVTLIMLDGSRCGGVHGPRL